MGGTHSKNLCFLSLTICKFLKDNCINYLSSHIAGKENFIADAFSRKNRSRHEYYFSQTTFNNLMKLIPFELVTDIFASKFSNKLPKYVSLYADQSASHINAFSFSWPDNIYLFPPINLVSKVVNKIIADEVNLALLITPAWASVISLPIIMSMLISNPIFIPSSFLLGSIPTLHPFNLTAWPISANGAPIRNFRHQYTDRCSEVFPPQHCVHINANGQNFINLLNKRGIEFLYLSP